MTGLLLIAVVAAWFFIARWIAKKATAKMQARGKKTALMVGIIAALMALPLADEIVGGFQFRALCEREATLQIDERTAVGKTVVNRSPYSAGKVVVQQFPVKIESQFHIYADNQTGEPVLKFKTFHAQGGLFIRTLGISGNNSPLVMPSYCPEGEPRNIFERLKLKISN